MTRFDELRGELQQRITDAGVASFSVGVSQGNDDLWLESFGWADRAGRREATPDTPYSLASITKTFTGAAIGILKQRGLVDLDVPADTYLDTPVTVRAGKPGDVTIRRIANHTAGFPLHYQFFYADEDYPRPPMAESIRRYGVVVAPPGERQQYSNFGFGVLDHIVSRVSGLPYADFLRREVFQPLGMHRSAVGVPEELAPHAAARYGTDGVAYPFYDFDHPGGSAVFSSASDMLRYGQFLVGARRPDQREILTPAAIEDLHTPTFDVDEASGAGVGWTIRTIGRHRLCVHGGSMGGVNTFFALVPAEQVAVVALANGTTQLPAWIVGEALRRVLDGYERPAEPAPVAPQPLAEVFSGRWTGQVCTYMGETPLELDVRPGGEIVAKLGTQSRVIVEIMQAGESRFLGFMQGRIDTPDARRRPHRVLLDLTLREDALQGAAVAMTDLIDGEGGAPGKRVGNALSHWTELRRA